MFGGGNKGKGFQFALLLVSLESPEVPLKKDTIVLISATASFCDLFFLLVVDGSCVLYFHKASPHC